jgi:diacylglycerol kinase family enzyme
MLSAGFDAEVVRRLGEWRAAGAVGLRRVTRASYVAPIAAALCTYRHAPLRLTAEQTRFDGVHCVVANVPGYALDLPLLPAARADDGVLDWVMFERGGLPALATYSWATWRGRHLARPDVRSGRATRLAVDASDPVPVQVDGDPWGTTPVQIEIVPGGLTLVAAD